MAIVAVTASGLKLLRKAVCERICQKNFVRSIPSLLGSFSRRRQRWLEVNLHCLAGRRFYMADIFISFKTDDTPRVQAVYDGFRARGLTVFWSNDIPIGAPNYQAIIAHEILTAPVVVVVWTNASVHSDPVAQECDQAKGTTSCSKLSWTISCRSICRWGFSTRLRKPCCWAGPAIRTIPNGSSSTAQSTPGWRRKRGVDLQEGRRLSTRCRSRGLPRPATPVEAVFGMQSSPS